MDNGCGQRVIVDSIIILGLDLECCSLREDKCHNAYGNFTLNSDK